MAPLLVLRVPMIFVDRYFWDVVLSLPLQLQKLFLLFTTGSDRVPIGGMAEMTLKISRTEDTDL